MNLTVVVEGTTDEPVARALAEDAGFQDVRVISMDGKGNIDRDLPRFAQAARATPWLVLRDLDRDAPCAPRFLDRLNLTSPWLCMRLAVRELESWLLADADGIASFLGIAHRQVPTAPDALQDPKATLIQLARKGKRKIRDGMAPGPRATRAIGPLYESYVIELAAQHWNLDRAARRSESLYRARAAIRLLFSNWKDYLDGGSPNARGGSPKRRQPGR